MSPHSFDPPRDRKVPVSFRGRWRGGAEVELHLRDRTLFIAVKPNCDGCRELLTSPLSELEGVSVIFVCEDDEGFQEWDSIRHPLLVSPEILQALDVRWPPFYVLVDATQARVVTEGVIFGASQIALEISHHLA